MTRVEFFITDDEYSIKCEGHSGYAESGSDIVCAGISTLMQSLIVHCNPNCYISSARVWANGTQKIDCARMVVKGLEMIANEYPMHLSIKEGCTMIRKNPFIK